MSFAERAIAEDERKQHTAAGIGFKVGLLKGCEFESCTEWTWNDSVEPESAYKYAAVWLSKNKSKDPLAQDFKNQKELTDMIKNLSNEFGIECACRRLIAKD